MEAEWVRHSEEANHLFSEKMGVKARGKEDRDFNEIVREKKKKKKIQRQQESWWDKRHKRMRAMFRAQAILASQRRGELSRTEQENHAKSQAAGANRLHNFLTEDTGREKRMPETVTDKKHPGTVNTYDCLRRAYLLSGRKNGKNMSSCKGPDPR